MASHGFDKRQAFFKRVAGKFGVSKKFPGVFEARADDERKPTPENYTMLQFFEWYVPADHQHWQRLLRALPELKKIGIDNIWIPPACKASTPEGNGYDIYDLYDLGEFNAKGSVGTKWGTKEELFEVCKKTNDLGIGLYFDAVLNHKAGADNWETTKVVKVDPNDRTHDISGPYDIDAWVGFDFEARGDKYSNQKYHWYHFSATDYDQRTQETAVYRILGENKHFATDVDNERGNYDFLMFADLDYAHPEVRSDVKNWGPWHYSEGFLLEFVQNLDKQLGRDTFCVGEFWKTSRDSLTAYLDKMHHKFTLFDAPLVESFHRVSMTERADLRSVWDGTLTQVEPWNSVTLVMNHDTQPSQALQIDVADWFIPLAHAFILLRIDGYPCLFYGNIYGIKGGVPNDWRGPSAGGKIPDMVLARKLYAYGELNDYMDRPNLIGWVRRGTWDRPNGCAVVLSNAEMGEIRMYVGTEHKGEVWTDIMGWESGEVHIGDDGFGMFSVGSCSVSIFVKKDAPGREKFGKFNDRIYV
ncbi:alpha-amylase [Cladophialophora yegresii CBS 114405]|uniref:Alpha-amylase n=1 Tax=Cladophialophora yegresii CBS 114405 TaxID=1182544 RepID=W9VSD1_9EURO|nr:alpha-amylase [Cladophialophora yegresii CBS 114405]EXJ55086.1 alpha-amylase [Cladophialophora yegresii CBS 114405]